MSEMVERVAAVVNRASHCDWRIETCRAGKCQCIELARAAIEAMREFFDEKHDMTSEHWSTVDLINAALTHVGPIPR